MFKTAIRLGTSEPAQQHICYTQPLALPLRQATAESFTVQAGVYVSERTQQGLK